MTHTAAVAFIWAAIQVKYTESKLIAWSRGDDGAEVSTVDATRLQSLIEDALGVFYEETGILEFHADGISDQQKAIQTALVCTGAVLKFEEATTMDAIGTQARYARWIDQLRAKRARVRIPIRTNSEYAPDPALQRNNPLPEMRDSAHDGYVADNNPGLIYPTSGNLDVE